MGFILLLFCLPPTVLASMYSRCAKCLCDDLFEASVQQQLYLLFHVFVKITQNHLEECKACAPNVCSMIFPITCSQVQLNVIFNFFLELTTSCSLLVTIFANVLMKWALLSPYDLWLILITLFVILVEVLILCSR